MSKNWGIIRERVQYRSPSGMIRVNQVDEIRSRPTVGRHAILRTLFDISAGLTSALLVWSRGQVGF